MQKSAAFLMVTVLLLGLFLMKESREEPVAGVEAAYADWIATNTTRPVQPTHVALVEINDNSLSSYPWPWAPNEFSLFAQDILPFQPDVVAIEPILDWQDVTIPGKTRQQMREDEKVLHGHLQRILKLVLGSRLGAPDDPDVVPPMRAVPLLRNIKGSTSAIPAFVEVESQAAEDYRLSATVGFTNVFDSGNVIRSIPLIFNYRGEIVPSFVLQALIQWYKLTPDSVTVDLDAGRIRLGSTVSIPIDSAGRMHLDFSAAYTHLGHDDLLLAVTEQEQNAAKRTAIYSSDALHSLLKGGIVLLARADVKSRTLLTPSFSRKSPGEISALALATIQGGTFVHRVTPIFDFALIALMMALACFFHRVKKRTFLLLSFVTFLGYLFLSLSVYSFALAWLPFTLPMGLLLLMNFFSLFSPREYHSAPVAAPPAAPPAGDASAPSSPPKA